jgi:glutamine cyclotransferase
VFYEGQNSEATARVELVSSVQPKLLNYKIVNIHPHDTLSFTEGLEFYKDTLYESTGQKGLISENTITKPEKYISK